MVINTIDTGSTQFLVDVSTATDVGCVREKNEDRIVCIAVATGSTAAENALLAIVADGMGGHAAGEIASQLTVDVIQKFVKESETLGKRVLEQAFQNANEAVYNVSQKQPEYSGMGTTGTALLIQGDKVLVAHVGDSRLYRIRKNNIVLLSEDHTLVREWVLSGVISDKEAQSHPNKNIITRSLGTNSTVQIYTFEAQAALAGDIYILCSDGLYDLVSDDEIASICSTLTADSACENLIGLAKQRGGDDNISMVVAVCRAV